MIAIIRHAHTMYNIKGEMGRFCGSSNPPLSNRGIKESYKVGNYFLYKEFKYIFTSPLLRAIETAEIISSILNLPLFIINDFREIDYGIWEGLTKSEILKQYFSDYQYFEKKPYSYTPPGGENPSKALSRFYQAFKKVNDSSIIVTHKTVSRLFMCKVKGIDLNNYRTFSDLKLGSISFLSDSSQPKLLDINITNHLK